MSAHLSTEQLWGAPSADAAAHLEGCADCRAEHQQVVAARALLQTARPQAPALDPIAMRRIGVHLKEAALEQAKRRGPFGELRAGFWPFAFHPAWLLAAAAAMLAVVVVSRIPPPPTPIARQQPAPAPTQLAVTPTVPQDDPVPPAPVALPRKPLLAKVTSARKAKGAKKAQELSEGAVVATEKGGALWMRLPDGSRAGLTGGSQLKLDNLDEKRVAMTLEKGSVVVNARHLPERVLSINAGEVEIRDVGTRFLVSRDVNRVLVAVEEGVVEVKAPGSSVTLKAGRRAEWREGQLVEAAWTPTPPPAPAPVKLVSPPTPAIVAVEPEPEPAPAPAPVPVAPVNPEDEYALPTNLPPTVVTAPPTSRPPAPPPVLVPAKPAPPEVPETPEEEEASVLTLAGIELRVKKLTRAVASPFASVGSSMRETRVREIGRLADEGNCEEALTRADTWLADKVSQSDDEGRWRRTVLVNQLRCYTKLKRDADAARVRKQLE